MTPDEFAIEEAELLSTIPTELQGYFSSVAYDRGHSAGYEEVLCILAGMICDFRPYWDNYTAVHGR